MKKLFIIALVAISISCSSTRKIRVNMEITKVETIYSKEDWLYCLKRMYESKVYRDKCEKYNWNCLFEPIEVETSFPGGTLWFFKRFNNNFKYTVPSKTKIKCTINRLGGFEKIKIFSKDIKLKSEITRVLKIDSLNKWKPSFIFGKPINSEIEFYISTAKY